MGRAPVYTATSPDTGTTTGTAGKARLLAGPMTTGDMNVSSTNEHETQGTLLPRIEGRGHALEVLLVHTYRRRWKWTSFHDGPNDGLIKGGVT